MCACSSCNRGLKNKGDQGPWFFSGSCFPWPEVVLWVPAFYSASSQLHYLEHGAFIHGSWVVCGGGEATLIQTAAKVIYTLLQEVVIWPTWRPALVRVSSAVKRHHDCSNSYEGKTFIGTGLQSKRFSHCCHDEKHGSMQAHMVLSRAGTGHAK